MFSQNTVLVNYFSTMNFEAILLLGSSVIEQKRVEKKM